MAVYDDAATVVADASVTGTEEFVLKPVWDTNTASMMYGGYARNRYGLAEVGVDPAGDNPPYHTDPSHFLYGSKS